MHMYELDSLKDWLQEDVHKQLSEKTNGNIVSRDLLNLCLSELKPLSLVGGIAKKIKMPHGSIENRCKDIALALYSWAQAGFPLLGAIRFGMKPKCCRAL